MHVFSPPLFISFKTNFKSTQFPVAETKKRNESSLLSGEGKEFEQKKREFIGKMSGNDIRDEEGNPIVLTDEHGNPVLLRDQNGNRIRIRGTAIRISAVDVDLIGEREHVPGTGLLSSTTTEVPTQHEAKQFAEENAEHRHRQQEQRVEEHDLRPEGVLQRTASSSSSSSSEDDGQGGRVKKKKGLTQKLKEKLAIGRHKDEHLEHVTTTATTTTTTAAPAVTGEHEKKGMMEKIREKLPMHHNHRTH